VEENALAAKTEVRTETKLPLARRIGKDWKKYKAVYFLSLIGVAYYVIFCYLPMTGILIAFEDYKPLKGVFGSTWVGLKYFKDFFSSHYFWRILRNTLMLNFYDVLIGFPAPIIFALLLNEVSNKLFKRTVQTISYLPYFISLVVVCGILVDFLSLNGLINQIVVLFGGEKTIFLQYPEYFRTIFVGSGIWQFLGYSAIIYLAALSSVDVQLYDAAAIDGCNRFQRVIHVTLPGIMSTIVIMFILRTGSLMNVGFEKIILLYNPSTYETSDVISSFIYRYGLLGGNFSYSTAVGLFNSVVNFGLIYLTNLLSRRASNISLW
jgi:putative aldouronate transport system permease protein